MGIDLQPLGGAAGHREIPPAVRLVVTAPHRVSSAWLAHYACRRTALAPRALTVSMIDKDADRPGGYGAPTDRVVEWSCAMGQHVNVLDAFAVQEDAAWVLADVFGAPATAPSPLTAWRSLVRAVAGSIRGPLAFAHLFWIASTPPWRRRAAQQLVSVGRSSGSPGGLPPEWIDDAWADLAVRMAPVAALWGRHSPEHVPDQSFRGILRGDVSSELPIRLSMPSTDVSWPLAERQSARLVVAAAAAAVGTRAHVRGQRCLVVVEPPHLVTAVSSLVEGVLATRSLDMVARWEGVGVPTWATSVCWIRRSQPMEIDGVVDHARGIYWADRLDGRWMSRSLPTIPSHPLSR